MTAKPNYYQLLNIAPHATEKEIRKAYRTMAKQLHPDVNPNDPGLEQRMKEISNAYAVLKNGKKRALYDQSVGLGSKIQRDNTQTNPTASAGGFTSKTYEDIYRQDSTEPKRPTYTHASDNSHMVAALMAFFGIYAYIVMFGMHLLDIKYLFGIVPVSIILWMKFGDYAFDLIDAPAAWKFNLLWLCVLTLAFAIEYHTVHGELEGQGKLVGSPMPDVLFVLFRLCFFVYWAIWESRWAGLLTPIVTFAFLPYLVLPFLGKKYIIGGWVLLALLILFTTIIRFDMTAMHHFILYYDPLFTVTPVK